MEARPGDKILLPAADGMTAESALQMAEGLADAVPEIDWLIITSPITEAIVIRS